MSKNNITGDNLVSKPTEGYQDGYDLIWGKKEKKEHNYTAYGLRQLAAEKPDRVLIKDNEKVTND